MGRQGRPGRNGSLAYAAFGGDKKIKKKKLGRRGRPGRGVSLAYAAFGGDKKIKKKIWGALGKKKRDPFHEDSKYVLGFEIGQRESGFYSERTESQTDRVTEPSSTVLVYRYMHRVTHKARSFFTLLTESSMRCTGIYF